MYTNMRCVHSLVDLLQLWLPYYALFQHDGFPLPIDGLLAQIKSTVGTIMLRLLLYTTIRIVVSSCSTPS